MVREWPAVKADIAQLKQKGSETSPGDSSSDPVTLNVSLVNLQEELNNERSLRLSLESTMSHRVSSADSGEITKLKLEIDKERNKRLAQESANLSLQKDSDSLSLQEKLQIASEENERHRLLIEDLNTRIWETHFSSPLFRPSVSATPVQELQAHIPSSKCMILEDLSTSRLPPSACPAPLIPSSRPSVPSSITQPVPLTLCTPPAPYQSNSGQASDTISDPADHKYHLSKRSPSPTKPSRTSLSTVSKLTAKFEKPILFTGSSLLKRIAENINLAATAFNLGLTVQINRGKTTQQIVAEVLKLPSLGSFEGVVLEIGTNDLSNLFPKKGPPTPEQWWPDEIYTKISEPIIRAFYQGLEEIR